MMNLSRSGAAFEEARNYMPGGVNSPVRSYPHMDCPPPFIASAKGSHITDIDGNTYIDYVGSWGPMILGHAHPRVISAIQKAAENSTSYGAPTVIETELASAGVTKGTAKDTVVVPYNDIDAFVKKMDDEGDGIAAVIVEPVAGNMGCVLPVDGFLETLRRETEKHGTVLIFDEVMCGFRTELHGAQGKYGIIPDMTCLGKIIGGGLPAAAYGGKRDIMNRIAPDGSVYQAGTLSGNPLAVTAGLETLQMIRTIPDFYKILEEKTKRLLDGWLDAAAEAGVAVQVHQSGSMFCLFFNDKPVLNYEDSCACDGKKFKAWFLSMLEQGIYLAPSPFETLFMSYAHSEDDLDRTISAARIAMKEAAEAK